MVRDFWNRSRIIRWNRPETGRLYSPAVSAGFCMACFCCLRAKLHGARRFLSFALRVFLRAIAMLSQVDQRDGLTMPRISALRKGVPVTRAKRLGIARGERTNALHLSCLLARHTGKTRRIYVNCFPFLADCDALRYAWLPCPPRATSAGEWFGIAVSGCQRTYSVWSRPRRASGAAACAMCARRPIAREVTIA